MFGTVIDKVSGYLERRFLINAVFPSFIFWGGILALVVSQTGGNELINKWTDAVLVLQASIIALFVVGILIFAFFLNIFTFSLLRLYEGYWGERGIGRSLAAWRSRVQENRFTSLDPRNQYDAFILYRYYPSKQSEVMPTRFGNVLKSAESYASDQKRYCMDTVFFWPRLYALLPDKIRGDLATARSAFEFMVVISALSWFFAFVAAIYLGVNRDPDLLLWLTTVGCGVLIGWLGYGNAVQAAAMFAELVKTAFDLYRGDLIKQMGYSLPTSLKEERKFWLALSQQLYYGLENPPPVLKYAAMPALSTSRVVLQKIQEILFPSKN